MSHLPYDPVGLPGLVALATGGIAFAVSLWRARARGIRAGRGVDSGRRAASIVGIVVQGIGIGITGLGPIRVTLDPASPKALLEAAAVLALMLAAVWLFDTSSRTMGRNWSLVARTRGDGQLVQSGPFALVRNPIYVALVCLMLALAISYGHVASLLVAAPVYALGTWMRVRHEEAVLRATFGAEYDRYAKRVKRFVPGVF